MHSEIKFEDFDFENFDYKSPCHKHSLKEIVSTTNLLLKLIGEPYYETTEKHITEAENILLIGNYINWSYGEISRNGEKSGLVYYSKATLSVYGPILYRKIKKAFIILEMIDSDKDINKRNIIHILDNQMDTKLNEKIEMLEDFPYLKKLIIWIDSEYKDKSQLLTLEELQNVKVLELRKSLADSNSLISLYLKKSVDCECEEIEKALLEVKIESKDEDLSSPTQPLMFSNEEQEREKSALTEDESKPVSKDTEVATPATPKNQTSAEANKKAKKLIGAGFVSFLIILASLFSVNNNYKNADNSGENPITEEGQEQCLTLLQVEEGQEQCYPVLSP